MNYTFVDGTIIKSTNEAANARGRQLAEVLALVRTTNTQYSNGTITPAPIRRVSRDYGVGVPDYTTLTRYEIALLNDPDSALSRVGPSDGGRRGANVQLLLNGRASAAGSTRRPSNDQQRVATSLPSTREASTAAQAPSTAPVSTPKPQEQSRKRGLDTAPPSQTAPLNAEGDDLIARDAEELAHAEERSKQRRRTTRQERVAAGKFVNRENPPVTVPATAHGPAPVQTTSANPPPVTASAAAPVLSTTQTFGSPPLSPIPTPPNPTPARIQTTNAAPSPSPAPAPAPKAALTPINNTSPHMGVKALSMTLFLFFNI